jgi:hypothetical protein
MSAKVIVAKTFFEAAAVTAVLFILHALPINKKFIEQKLMADPKNPKLWALSVSYYFLGFLATVGAVHFASSKLSRRF